MQELEEIEATFRRERIRFDETVIAETVRDKKLLTVKGPAEEDELKPGLHYRFYGRYQTYKNKRTGDTERQFVFSTFVNIVAHDRRGVVEYLKAVGKGLGFGQAWAEKAYEAFGGEAVKRIREGGLAELNPPMTEDNRTIMVARLTEMAALEDATIEVTNLLAGRGLPKATAREAIKRWGNRAGQVIHRNPYALMSLTGVGFKRCDALYLEFGHNPSRLKRQALCGWYALKSSRGGHIWHPVSVYVRAVIDSIPDADPKRALALGIRLGRLSPQAAGAIAGIRTAGPNGGIEADGQTPWVAEGGDARNEELIAAWVSEAQDENAMPLADYVDVTVDWQAVANAVKCSYCSRELTAKEVHILDGRAYGPVCIKRLSQGGGVITMLLEDWKAAHPSQITKVIKSVPTRGRSEAFGFNAWPSPDSVGEITEHQRHGLTDALRGRLGILGGSPGTGKTYVTAQLIKQILESVSAADIAVGCPTGKAAVRITQALAAAGLRMKARTWHSLLGFGADGGFEFHQGNPWPFKYIIGDESSMLDAALFKAILAARPRGCHALFVGDVNQLPPVGNGAPMRDMINSGQLGYGELREIKRNSGGIAEACAAIRDSQPWKRGGNLIIDDERDASIDPWAAISPHLERAAAEGLDPVWDCQVLVAVNEKSPLARKTVNVEMQRNLNARNPQVSGSPFRMNDKVICLKNGNYQRAGHKDEERIANGEIGKVTHLESSFMIVEIPGDPTNKMIRVPRAKGSATDPGCHWDLAYAISTHKSQGSEWPWVITLLDEYPGAKMICDREWIYTAISRGQHRSILIGKESTARRMSATAVLKKRKTLLTERLSLTATNNVLEGIT